METLLINMTDFYMVSLEDKFNRDSYPLFVTSDQGIAKEVKRDVEGSIRQEIGAFGLRWAVRIVPCLSHGDCIEAALQIVTEGMLEVEDL